MSKIIVVGSSNIDFTACVDALPKPGETVGGARFQQANGGKGANQAVTVGRLGGDVLFMTCLGSDAFGHSLHESFVKDHIRTDYVKVTDKVPTGTALILVDARGENCIAVSPGANSELRPSDIDHLAAEMEEAEYLLIQLEIPMDTVEEAINLAHRHHVKVVLNPAPFTPLPDSLLEKVYLATPNMTEAGKLAGVPVSGVSDAEMAAESLMRRGVKNVIVTMGEKGSLVCEDGKRTVIPSKKVKVIDTTAAGDVYNGALLTALSRGERLVDAAHFATACSAVSITRWGAQTSIPYYDEVK